MVAKANRTKARLEALKLEAAEYLLTLVGPSLLKLVRDKRRWEEMRQLLLKVASSRKHSRRNKE